MADLEQEFKESVAQHLADQITGPMTVQEAEDMMQAISAQLGSYGQLAKETFKGIGARADKDGDGTVTAEELRQALLAL
ncbi:EF-hand domain-containing protein [Kitasatospora sp. NPDC002040]|uniref:EF-hand domain-containing protein n=1 Tax=Kitasatospora sp. NPDC002040 TaxID=3154661 RepID=UPI003316CCF5